jgi:hypothetical protein
VLVLAGMTSVKEIDKENMAAVCEPGVITADLQRVVEREGLFYPPDPSSLKYCTIGGNLAENAGGPRGLKYGVTKDYVLGLEVALPNGEVVRLGGKQMKNATQDTILSSYCRIGRDPRGDYRGYAEAAAPSPGPQNHGSLFLQFRSGRRCGKQYIIQRGYTFHLGTDRQKKYQLC